jgi:hypothetical protein
MELEITKIALQSAGDLRSIWMVRQFEGKMPPPPLVRFKPITNSPRSLITLRDETGATCALKMLNAFVQRQHCGDLRSICVQKLVCVFVTT